MEGKQKRSATGKLEYVNPKTGRPIVHGSRVFLELQAAGYTPIPKTSSYRDRMPTQERVRLKSKCGAACFLLPDTNRYPICKSGCKTDCSMVADALRKSELVLATNTTTLTPRALRAHERAHKQAQRMLLECATRPDGVTQLSGRTTHDIVQQPPGVVQQPQGVVQQPPGRRDVKPVKRDTIPIARRTAPESKLTAADRDIGSIPSAVAAQFPLDRYDMTVWRHKTLGLLYEPREKNVADANRMWYSPTGQLEHWESGNPWKKPTPKDGRQSRDWYAVITRM